MRENFLHPIFEVEDNGQLSSGEDTADQSNEGFRYHAGNFQPDGLAIYIWGR